MNKEDKFKEFEERLVKARKRVSEAQHVLTKIHEEISEYTFGLHGIVKKFRYYTKNKFPNFQKFGNSIEILGFFRIKTGHNTYVEYATVLIDGKKDTLSLDNFLYMTGMEKPTADKQEEDHESE